MVKGYAISEDGCITVDSISISKKTFEEHLNLVFPNVFTPNNDGKNEKFTFSFDEELKGCLDFKIYNRWGNLIYETQSNELSWDGKASNGIDCSMGVYVYVLNIDKLTLMGSITILR